VGPNPTATIVGASATRLGVVWTRAGSRNTDKGDTRKAVANGPGEFTILDKWRAQQPQSPLNGAQASANAKLSSGAAL